ncbi:hypothetical protein BDBG_16346 [Blastomyces gilchristii SLH14081]|uniref:Uncharacterized protein n=1 Tax=Blastomyces gilchristii (strain SLH14081) TaxID=559298 RepID=A0A179U9V3_BLAGS|nr:uncharacterized protein BDBG_16346 [Blastomyces gilchristii SLH14081]OAT04775.1 hypothetical protein BDBG_16346 [Blastomyces gilchristii SLH14081]
MKDLIMAKPQKMKVMLKMTDEIVISAAAIEDTKISVKEMNMLLNNVYYILKLEVNLMSMTRLNKNDIYEMKRLIIYRDLIWFAILNDDFEPVNILQIKDDTILTLSDRNDTKVIELMMMQDIKS